MAVRETDHFTSEDSFCFALDVGAKTTRSVGAGMTSATAPTDRHLVHLDVVPELIEEMDLVRAAVERHIEKISVRNESESGTSDLTDIAALYVPVREAVRKGARPQRVGLPFATIATIDGTGVPYILVSSHLGFREAIFAAFASLLDISNMRQTHLPQKRLTHSQNAKGPQQFSGLSSHRTDLIFNGRVLPAYRR